MDKTSGETQPHRLQLTAEQIKQVNDALATLRDFGEVHLIVQHGALKYINILKSNKAWDDQASGDESSLRGA